MKNALRHADFHGTCKVEKGSKFVSMIQPFNTTFYSAPSNSLQGNQPPSNLCFWLFQAEGYSLGCKHTCISRLSKAEEWLCWESWHQPQGFSRAHAGSRLLFRHIHYDKEPNPWGYIASHADLITHHFRKRPFNTQDNLCCYFCCCFRFCRARRVSDCLVLVWWLGSWLDGWQVLQNKTDNYFRRIFYFTSSSLKAAQPFVKRAHWAYGLTYTFHYFFFYV